VFNINNKYLLFKQLVFTLLLALCVWNYLVIYHVLVFINVQDYIIKLILDFNILMRISLVECIFLLRFAARIYLLAVIILYVLNRLKVGARQFIFFFLLDFFNFINQFFRHFLFFFLLFLNLYVDKLSNIIISLIIIL
jgi:hypothetical protein